MREPLVCQGGGGGGGPTPPLLKAMPACFKAYMNPFRTHHVSIHPLERGGGAALFLAGQTCFNHTNPVQTHDDASINGGGGGVRPPTTRPLFVAGQACFKACESLPNAACEHCVIKYREIRGFL